MSLNTDQAEERTKVRYPLAHAERVAFELVAALEPFCSRIVVAGSIRRRKLTVGDVEILYVSRLGQTKADLFADTAFSLADMAIGDLERDGVLRRRLNVNGSEVFGARNKLMVHVRSGIPVDLFAASEESWWNYLVCRTGGAKNNMRIATKAQLIGQRWNPYGAGFTRLSDREQFAMKSEEMVFEHVGLPYLKPEERE